MAGNNNRWLDLYSLLEGDRKLAMEEERKREIPTVCPICWTALDRRPDGAVNCIMGHYRRDA